MRRNGLLRIQKLHTNRQETRGELSGDFKTRVAGRGQQVEKLHVS